MVSYKTCVRGQMTGARHFAYFFLIPLNTCWLYTETRFSVSKPNLGYYSNFDGRKTSIISPFFDAKSRSINVYVQCILFFVNLGYQLNHTGKFDGSTNLRLTVAQSFTKKKRKKLPVTRLSVIRSSQLYFLCVFKIFRIPYLCDVKVN